MATVVHRDRRKAATVAAPEPSDGSITAYALLLHAPGLNASVNREMDAMARALMLPAAWGWDTGTPVSRAADLANSGSPGLPAASDR